jgi:Zinc finger C-x8-C-x5-C-x3-H type (and similar)
MGNCQYGDKCTYAHGDKDLRRAGAAGGSQPTQNSYIPISATSVVQPPAMP